ncbi:MAG TPA: RNB domain-containing ribonuclease [Terriglobales bacterium]|nr:RNB domain-containing ribonuclease [Terriglobales bacterium]
MPTDREILARIARQPNQAAGFKQLVRELGLRGGEDRRHLEERLQKLMDRGELISIGRDRFTVPAAAAKQNLIAGELSVHRDGYGFVKPRDASVRDKIAGDIYISPRAMNAAMSGDQVLVEVGPTRGDGRAEGSIVKVIGRAHPTVVGTFHYGDRYNYVQPIDDKITDPIVIPRGMEVPESKVESRHAPSPHAPGRESRHRVIGKEARRSHHADLEGVVVDVEIVQWPSGSQNARGKVIEVLGYENDFGVDVEIVIRKHHIPHVFPAEVLEEAESFTAVLERDEVAGREDYRNLPIVTIDGETARDFDDAVLVRKAGAGNYELQVHIADVANYVTDGSAIDAEARMRGTSVYFPDRAVPMLPLELSTDLCSLRPQVERLVLSCIMEIDHAGEVVSYELHQGLIRSAARMTYNEVQAILDGDPSMRKQYAQLVPEFERMQELAKILNRKRVKRGSIDFDMPEPVIEFDEAGLMQSVTRSERKFSHRIIEEFMLAANECVAEYLESHSIASLYRIHEKPDAKKVYDFELLAAAFGYSLGVGALPVKRFQTRGERRERHGSGRNPRQHEIPEDVHITPRMYQKLTQKIAGKPEERILSYLMLRSLKQARYSEENEGHFALAAPTYTHFTSPIRRYPDLIVHRILKAVLSDGLANGHGDGLSHSHKSVAQEPSAAMHAGDGRHKRGSGRPRPGVADDGHEPSPWSKRRAKDSADGKKRLTEIIPLDELHEIAVDSSMTERRADEAERELIEWKKIKFMEDKVGDEFNALVVSVTKYGLFVEVEDLFVEGLVPIGSLSDDRYTYRENTRQIIGDRSGHAYSIGDRVRVILDRIDRAQRKLQFAIVEEQRKTEKRTRRARG